MTGASFPTRVAGLLAVYLTVSCAPECPDPVRVESGTYLVTRTHYGEVLPGDEWVRDALIGAKVVVDRETGTARIRYEVDGSIFQVTARLEER